MLKKLLFAFIILCLAIAFCGCASTKDCENCVLECLDSISGPIALDGACHDACVELGRCKAPKQREMDAALAQCAGPCRECWHLCPCDYLGDPNEVCMTCSMMKRDEGLCDGN